MWSGSAEVIVTRPSRKYSSPRCLVLRPKSAEISCAIAMYCSPPTTRRAARCAAKKAVHCRGYGAWGNGLRLLTALDYTAIKRICHPERTREGSGLEAPGQILREYAQDESSPK